MDASRTPPPPAVFTVPASEAGLRADVYLALRLPFLSRTRVKQKIQTGESLLNGRRYATSARLAEGDRIVVYWRRVPDPRPAPALTVLYEDDDLIAVEKPAGVAAHPGGRIQTGTAIQFIRERLARETENRLRMGDTDFYPNLVNRLDRFTSGVLLAAKKSGPLAVMHALAARGGIGKTYRVVVEGRLDPDAGRIEAAIGPDPESGIALKMRVRPGGAPCLTEYRVLERREGHTLLAVFPLTGRQHQIRVHMAHIGHPVWGDLIYKDPDLFKRYLANGGETDGTLPPRHLLHAERTVFPHPVTGKQVVIESPVPRDFLEILEDL